MKNLFKGVILMLLGLLISCQSKVESISQEEPLNQTELVDRLSHDADFTKLIDGANVNIMDTIKVSLDRASQDQFDSLKVFVKNKQFNNPNCMKIVKNLGIDKAINAKVNAFNKNALAVCGKYKSSFNAMNNEQKMAVLNRVHDVREKNLRKLSVCDDCGGDVERGIWTELATGILCVLSGWDPSCDAASDGFLTMGLSIGVCIYCCTPGVNCR